MVFANVMGIVDGAGLVSAARDAAFIFCVQ